MSFFSLLSQLHGAGFLLERHRRACRAPEVYQQRHGRLQPGKKWTQKVDLSETVILLTTFSLISLPVTSSKFSLWPQ